MSTPLVIRWGWSPYETTEVLAHERRRIEALGLECRQVPMEVPASELEKAEVLVITSLRRVEQADLQALNHLRLLVTTTSGYDHIDLHAARARGVMVARLPMARRDAVVESALSMALSLLRDMPRMLDEAREGRWIRAELPLRAIERLHDVTVGIIGLGVIGRRMAEVLSMLGAGIVTSDPAGRLNWARMTPAEMVTRCRVVTLHCNMERGAAPVIDREILAHARPDLILVNTARGRVIDLDAAWQALREDRIGALALDVFPQEPFPQLAALAAHPRVLVTPHAAGYHDRLGMAIADELVAALLAWREQREIPNRVI